MNPGMCNRARRADSREAPRPPRGAAQDQAALGLEALSNLQNMSAPPRSTLTLVPFRAVTEPGLLEPSQQTAWGFVWRRRVDIVQTVHHAFPGLLPWDLALLRQNPYLVGAVGLARRFRGLEADLDLIEVSSREDLSDELVQLCPRQGEVQGLPNQMMVTPADQVERVIEGDPVTVLSVLTHLSGQVFDMSLSPRVADYLLKGEALDLWTPAEGSHV